MGRKQTAQAKRRARRPSWWRQPLSLPPIERGTLADRTADAIRRRIVLGQVRPGQRLEPMREVARQLGVSLGVVREAVAQLKAEGMVEVRQGRGTFVARRPRAARTLRAVQRRARRADVAELRTAVEPVVAASAAKSAGGRRRGRERELGELRLAVGERSRARASPDAQVFTTADLEVHRAVARLSGNAVAAAACRMATIALQPDLAARARVLAGDERLNELHAALLYAIEEGRPVRARRAALLIAAIESGARSPP